jgi:hypothetical protein
MESNVEAAATFQSDKGWLKAAALKNVPRKLRTSLIFWLKELAEANVCSIFLTLDVFQVERY